MLEQSFVYNLAMKLWQVIHHYFRASIFGRGLYAVGRYMLALWRRSLMYALVILDLGGEGRLKGGAVGRLLGSISSLFDKLSAKIAPLVSNSRAFSALPNFFDNLLYLKMWPFGLVLVLLGGIPFAQALTYGELWIYHYIYGAMAAAGLFMLIINRSFAAIYRGSWFLQMAGGLFYTGALDDKTISINKKYLWAVALAAIYAVGMGIAAIHLDFVMVFMASFGLLAAAMVFYKTEVGIFAAAFLTPLLPTMLILALLALTVLSYITRLIFTNTAKLSFNLVDVFVLFFGLVVVISVFVSYNAASSVPVAAVYLLFVLFFFTVKNNINTKGKLYAIFSLMALSGLLVALYGIYQRVTGQFVMTDAWVDADFFDESLVRIYSTLENPNVLGEYLIFINIFAFSMLYYFKNYLYKLGALGIFGAAALCMVFTQSRGAWLGLLVAAMVFVLIRDRRLIVLGVMALIAAPFIIPPEIIARFISIGDMADSSTAFRVSIWLASLDMARVFWPIGIGLGTDNFVFIYNIYAYSAAYALHSHNLFLQIIITLGIGGFIAFIGYMLCFFKSGVKTSVESKDKFVKTASAAMAAAMAGFMAQGFVDNTWFNYRVTAFFWLILALGAALINISKEDKGEKAV